MSDDTEALLDEKYRHLSGRLTGYLPQDRDAVDRWQRRLMAQIASVSPAQGRQGYRPSVEALAKLIEANGIVRMYVDQMIDGVPPRHKVVHDSAELLAALNHIIATAPPFNEDARNGNFFPMSSLLVYMMLTTAGEAAFRYEAFNEAMRGVLQAWCQFLNSAESRYVLNTGEEGWLSPAAYKYNKLYDYEIPDPSAPHWGFTSFNDYFHRQIKPAVRPIDAPDDPKVVVSANDGNVYAIARNVKEFDRFWIKGQPYSLSNMLNGSEYVERFIGGDVFQSYLSGSDYHRWRAPIAGVVRHTEVVNGLLFSDAESAGRDTTAGTYSQGYGASVNTRGLIFIESEDSRVGMICVIPIGITEVSSIGIEVSPGDVLKKGDELGWFSFGGSSMCLVFQPNAIDHFTVPAPPPGRAPDGGARILVNAQIAAAR